MKNLKFYLSLFLILFISKISAQPYYYCKTEYILRDSIFNNLKNSILKVNLSNPLISDTLLYNHGQIENILIDKTNNWIALKNSNLLEIVDINNTDIIDTLSKNCYGLENFNYSPILNKFIILFDNDEPPNYKSLIIADVQNLSISDTIPFELYETAYNYYLSKSNTEIYFFDIDTLTHFRRISIYSILEKRITKRVILDSLGISTPYKWIEDIKNDIALVLCGFENSNINDDYWFCDSLKNYIAGDTLYLPYRTRGFLLPNSNYYLIEKVPYDSTKIVPEIKTGKFSIYRSFTNKLIANIVLPPGGRILTFDNFPNNFYYYIDSTKEAYTINVDSLTNEQTNSNLTVKLTNSAGSLLTGGSLQYYEGAWKDAVNNGDGTFAVNTDKQSLSLRMTYEHGTQTVSNVPAQNNTFTFQTVNTVVQLKNSHGNLINEEGTVKYYAGAWRDFGTTVNGVASKELLPNNYSFRMTYAYGSNDKQQDIGTNPTVVFQTVNANVQLKNSAGNLIDEGTVKYYAGAWRDFGTTVNGVASKELLSNNYNFRMSYAYGSNNKQQNIGDNPTVVFQTVNTNVQLQNSVGTLIDEGTVKYYAGAWRDFGTTVNGVASKELLPNNYSFRMTYEFVSNDKQQNIGSNSIVSFSTVLCTVKVNNAQNQPVDNADVKYYASAWRNFGTTINGEATKELLPSNLSFRASANGVSQDKQQDISSNSTVEIILNTGQ